MSVAAPMMLAALALAQMWPTPPPPAPPPIPTYAMPAQPANGRAPWLINLDELFNPDAYPFWARNLEVEGKVRVKVEVDVAGRPIACEILESSGSAEIDGGTCALLVEKGRFAPATDRKGKRVAGNFVRAIRWQLEERKALAVIDSHVRTIFTLGKSGEVTGCRYELSSDLTVDDIDKRMCKEFGAMPAMAAMYGGPEFDWLPWLFVMETSQFAGTGEGAATVGSRPGEQAFDHVRSRLTIDPRGNVTRCEIIERGHAPEEGVEKGCARAMVQPFLPAADGKDRQLTIVSAVYLRKK